MKIAHVVVLLMMLSSQLLANEILRTTESWDGGSFAYPAGEAEVTTVVMSLDAGEETPFHCHPVPTLGYISLRHCASRDRER